MITQQNTRLRYKERVRKDFQKNFSLYLLMLPVILFYLYFHYKPMYGLIMAFQNYNVRTGILGSQLVGLKNFVRFFADPYFKRNIVNTINISLANIVFGFPAPLILALLINELQKKWFVKTVQTISYMPHFISLVVICSMVRNFLQPDGLINAFLSGGKATESMLNNAGLFVPIYVLSDIWQEVGFGSIIYIAALSGIDVELYEAAKIDGAGRIRQTWNITLPCLMPTVIVLLILRLGNVLTVGYEKIILLTNPFNAETSEVLSYYIYQKGILSADYGLATAAGLFNSFINCFFVIAANKISRGVSGLSLW